MTAFDSDRGLCVHLEGVTRANLGGGACGFDVPHDRAASLVETHFREPAVTAAYGPVATGVEVVILEMDDGIALRLPVVRSPDEIGFSGGFFATVVPGSVNVERVEALGADGASLEARAAHP
ncbi:MAG TPA: hypothetical protein VHJ34_10865 [Actinomycetota bacterium]|nr:hypothetical protein [Actinomycetota bacterium]